MLGRRVETDAFRVLFEDLADGRGRCVLVEGEPGIGKTALLDAVLRQARTVTGLTVCAAACDELAAHTPLSVLLKALGPSSAADTERAERPDAAPGLPTAAAVERVFALIDRRSAEGPLVLAVDDLHAADEASLLVWQRLCAATARTPLLLIGTLRPVPRRNEIDRLRRILKDNSGVSISLDRLTAQDVATLAGHLLGAKPGPRLVERLASAGGNPLYVHELVDALSGSAAIVLEDGKAELPDAEPGAPTRTHGVVDSLAAAVADRLGFLGPETFEVLRTAALLGPEFAVTDLSAALGRPAGLLALAVQEAVAAGIVEPVGLRLRFRHGMLRQALHETIPGPERTALRRAAGRALIENAAPVERVAELIVGDLDAADGWETEWVAQHATELARRSPELAADVFEHILDHADLDAQCHAELRYQLADLCFLLARYERAAELAQQTRDHAQDPDRRGHATWIRANALRRLGLPDRHAETEPDADLPEIWQARLLATQPASPDDDAATHALAPAPAPAPALALALAPALARGEQLADPMTIAYALHTKASASFQASDIPACLDIADRALSAVGSLPEFTDVRILLSSLRISALADQDRFDEAAETLRAARAIDERVGSTRLAPYAVSAAELAYEQGRWDDALTELSAIRGVSPTALHPRHPDTVHGLSALIALHRDDQRTADRHLKALTDAATPTRTPTLATTTTTTTTTTPTPYALLARALNEERAGKSDAALAILRAILEPSYPYPHDRATALPTLVRLALAQDDAPTAARATATTATAHGYVAQWCSALVCDNPAQLAEAADHLRSVGRRPELAWALEDLAVLRIRDGAAPARTALAEALALSRECGAVWDVRRATARLRAHGVRLGNRTANRPRTGPQSLTETERRIAELVGQGMSNPDIAAFLSLSRRTVETHVSRILAKLGAKSRREVAGALLHE